MMPNTMDMDVDMNIGGKPPVALFPEPRRMKMDARTSLRSRSPKKSSLLLALPPDPKLLPDID